MEKPTRGGRVEGKKGPILSAKKREIQDINEVLTQDGEDLGAVPSNDDTLPEEFDIESLDFTSQDDDEAVEPLTIIRELQLEPVSQEEDSAVEKQAEPTATLRQSAEKIKALSHELLSLSQKKETLAQKRTTQAAVEPHKELQEHMMFLEHEIKVKRTETLQLKKELEQKQLEVSILKKRHVMDLNELNALIKELQDRNDLLEKKEESFQQEMNSLTLKIREDFQRIQQREKELEEELDLLKADTQSQLGNRDQKVLELKRKIDSLEFEKESMAIQERKEKALREEAEEKLELVTKSLRELLSELKQEQNYLKAA